MSEKLLMASDIPCDDERKYGMFTGEDVRRCFAPLFSQHGHVALDWLEGEYSGEQIAEREAEMERLAAGDVGAYDDEPEQAPDTWEAEGPEPLSDADREWAEWTQAGGS